METLIVHAETKAELKVIKGVMKALKVKFEDIPYNAAFTAKIKQGRKDIKAGRTTNITLNDIWK
jgi:hypothetical protein